MLRRLKKFDGNLWASGKFTLKNNSITTVDSSRYEGKLTSITEALNT